MARQAVPAAGQAVLPRQRLLIRKQQRLVAGVEARALDLRHRLGRHAARFHEGERLGNPLGGLLIFLRPRAAIHEVVRPGVDLVEVRIAAAREGAQQVQRRRRLVVRLDHARGVGLAARRLEADIVDDVTAIAGQRDAVHLFHVGRTRLCELTRHAAELHDRHLRREGQHDRHLQQHAEGVANIVRMEFGEAFGAVAALKQESLAFRHAAEVARQVARLAREDERRIACKFLFRRGERRVVAIGGELAGLVRAPAMRLPLFRHIDRLLRQFPFKRESPAAMKLMPPGSKRERYN